MSKNTLESLNPESSLSPVFGRDDGIARVAIAEDGVIVYASHAFCDLSHVAADEMRQIQAGDIIKFKHAHNLDDLEAGVHDIKINGHKEIFSFHFDWLQTPDQKRYLIGSHTDEKRKATRKSAVQAKEQILSHLQENKKTIEDILDNQRDIAQFMAMSADMMLVLDVQGKVIKANAAFSDVVALEKDAEFAGFFLEHEAPHIRTMLGTLHFGQDEGADIAPPLSFDAQMIDDQGAARWIAWRATRKDGMIYCMGRDITNIKAQEEALGAREKQLREAQSIGHMGHWRWRLGEEEMNWSDELYHIFGLNAEETQPTIFNMNEMIDRSDLGRVNKAFQRAIIEENDYDMEFSIKRPDGEERFIRCEGRCEKDENGEVIALFGVMQDMTERMLYERELKEAKESAERAYSSKTQFLANMSHELRTPLNAIIGFSEMIERQLLGPIGTEKYLEYIGGIRESGEHLLDLISDILDMSKIEAGKYELALEQLNVEKTIGMAMHMMEGRAHENNNKIEMSVKPTKNLSIIADRRALMQMMLNLLSNAVKFSKAGGNVDVECHEREDYLAIKVIDRGIGIPAHKLGQITKPFEQVSSSYTRDHEGSGLGLAITKELAEMHGGLLAIESVVDEGTTVTIRLPYDAHKAMKDKMA